MTNAQTEENIKKLTQQILAQGTSSKWTGEGKGSAQKNAADMARIIADTGVTDINQFGKIITTVDAAVQPVYGKGNDSQKIIGYVDQNGKPVDPSLVKVDTVYSGGDGGTSETVYTAPVGEKVLFGNKLTGQEVANTYSERQTGNFFGGTFEGKGNTGFGVQFDAKGNPIFYSQGASSNDIVNFLGDDPLLNAIAQIGASYFGGPLGSAALNAAMGKDLKDIAKSAALSYAGGQAAKAVSGMEGITDIFGKTGADIASKATGQFVASGGKADPLSILLSQGVSSATNTLTAQIPGFADLPNYAKTFVNQTVGNTIANKGNLSSDALLNAAMSAGVQAIKTASTFGPGDMDQFKKDLIPGYFLPGGEGYVASGLDKTYGPSETFDPSQFDWASLYADTSSGSPAGKDTSTYKAQDFGSDPNKYWDEFMNSMNQISNKGGFTSGWQTLGTNRVMVNDDGGATVFDPTTQESSFLTQEQVDALVKGGSLNTAASGYVSATGGTGDTPGGSGTTTKVTTTDKTKTDNQNVPTGGATQMLQAPSQDPYANIKSMEELFGNDIGYKLRALGENPSQKTASSDMDELVKLLRG